jgi:PAS domain S-box-containing protein/putative nucleotidyltransferase with HDIG domain
MRCEPPSPARAAEPSSSIDAEALGNLGFFSYCADPSVEPPQWRFADFVVPHLQKALLDTNSWFQCVLPEERDTVLEGRSLLGQGKPWTGVYQVRAEDGQIHWVEDRASLERGPTGQIVSIRGVIQDVTAKKAYEENLRRAEERYKVFIDNQGEGAVMVDADENFLFANPAADETYGLPRGGLVGHNVRQFTSPEQSSAIERQTSHRRSGEKSVYELQIVRPNGELRILRNTATPHFDEQGKYLGAFAVFVDITERKQADEERNRLATFLQMAPIPIVEVEIGGKLLYTNAAAKELFPDLASEQLQHPFLSGLPSAIALMARQRLDSVIRGVQVGQILYQQAIYATPGRRSLRMYAINVSEREQAEQALQVSEQRYRILVERNLAGVYRSTRDGQILDCNDAFAQILGYQSRDEILHETAGTFYFDPKDREAFVNQLFMEGSLNNWEMRTRRKDGKEIWVLENSTLIVGESGGSISIQGTVMDITERKRDQQLLVESYRKLSQRLDQTVQALSTLAEMKDPYTAGHQAHVTQLVMAIGQELNLPAEQREGLRVAATLHDLGKLYVPAEILSKPGRLSDIEFRMIQTHPTVGYEILHAIDFPWPVAEIILQHHERMDGSGYPRGIPGGQIMLEARILAVADVVEAMSFHRPYRPAHGIEKALAEVEEKRSTIFDDLVVTTCLRLFREKGFQFQV